MNPWRDQWQARPTPHRYFDALATVQKRRCFRANHYPGCSQGTARA